MNLVLRKPRDSDFPGLLLLTQTIVEEFAITRLIQHYSNLSSEEFARAFRIQPSWSAVLQVGEEIAGYVLIGPKAEDPGSGELDKLYVAAKFRHQGFGYLLMNCAIAAAQHLRFSSLYIDTAREFGVSSFYKRFGAREIEDHRHPEVADSLALELEIPRNSVFIRQPPGTCHRAPTNVNLGCGWEPAPETVKLRSLTNAARALLDSPADQLSPKTIARAKRSKCWFYWRFADAWARQRILPSFGDDCISAALFLLGGESKDGQTFAEARAELFRQVITQRFGAILENKIS